jgi:hypothetical protein
MRVPNMRVGGLSACGIVGARVDSIAKTAECNKNLIYLISRTRRPCSPPFSNEYLLRVYEDLVVAPEDLPGYATRGFDFAMARSDPEAADHPAALRRNFAGAVDLMVNTDGARRRSWFSRRRAR